MLFVVCMLVGAVIKLVIDLNSLERRLDLLENPYDDDDMGCCDMTGETDEQSSNKEDNSNSN